MGRWTFNNLALGSVEGFAYLSCIWRHRKVKNILTVSLLVAFLYFLLMLTTGAGRDEQIYARELGLKIRIIKWLPGGETERGDFNRRIFFHETSGRSDLGLRQTCTVESAAKNNPGRPIQVFMTADRLDYSSPWLEVLQNYPNVSIVMVDPRSYFSKTPLDGWYTEGEWRKSMYNIVHLSDYIRVLTLLKGGGMYMDLDIITLKSLDEKLLRNFFLFETEEMKLLSNSVLHLERGHWLIDEMIQRLVKYYDPNEYMWHGPSMISNIMSRKCGVKRGQPNSNNCTDVHILPHYNFAPISNNGWEILFGDATPDRLAQVTNGSYGVHCWSGKSKEEQLKVHSNQVYSVLAREHCPLTIAFGAADFLA
ncbi:lactosylceramide 4-alpha-galactosyltransferase-like isoform X3 [Daphnia pulex]|uniref:lactosylceramide 4-alpha-galactosyltransferase-like isoform X3 n=2 Tax=Daphnia pulex TaxID=6669 RepID=UPI001EE0D319|nr:lactosylceramide 4-alpha-galactosyltransferase-like isoform X3 [Daphnia pulex]